jgi:hypothetical protein
MCARPVPPWPGPLRTRLISGAGFQDTDFHSSRRRCGLDFDDDPEHFLEPEYVAAMLFLRDIGRFAGTNFEIRWTAA